MKIKSKTRKDFTQVAFAIVQEATDGDEPSDPFALSTETTNTTIVPPKLAPQEKIKQPSGLTDF